MMRRLLLLLRDLRTPRISRTAAWRIIDLKARGK